MNDASDFNFNSARRRTSFLVVDGQRIAETKLLVPSTARARWTVIEEGWTVDGHSWASRSFTALPPAA